MISTMGWLIPASGALIALTVWGTLAYGAKRAGVGARFISMSGAVLLGWLGAAMALGAGGVFEASATRTFPALLIALVAPIAAGVWTFRRSAALRLALDSIPAPWLVGIQLYRVIGVVFLALYFGDLLPVEFALPAGAGDVVVGLAAPVVAWMFVKRAQGSGFTLLGWNLVGVLDLVIAVATGFLTSPGPLQAFSLDAPNDLITARPLVLVPAFAVPLSILLHLAVFRKLKSEMAILAGRDLSRAPKGEGWISRLITI